jgi:hypothetical protein
VVAGVRGEAHTPFKFCGDREIAWSHELMPRNYDSWDRETFASWRERNVAEVGHLPDRLSEQWVYRHWCHSPFKFLPLADLAFTSEAWSGDKILSNAFRLYGGELNAQFDYQTFQRKGGDDRHATAKALDQGTWDYPMILLSTPHGIIDFDTMHLGVRYVIVEGHQRHRYLNALHVLGKPPQGPHEVMIISSPMISLA